VFQTVVATEAFNEQELAALEKIKATVEGRLRYNQVLLDILSEGGVENNEKVKNFCIAAGASVIENVSASYLAEGVKADIELLKITQSIVEESLVTQAGIDHYLTFLQMNIELNCMDFSNQFHKGPLRGRSGDEHFHELNFYKTMHDYANEAFRKPLHYNEVFKIISMVDRRFQMRFDDSRSKLFLSEYYEIEKKHSLTEDKVIQERSFICFGQALLSLHAKLGSLRISLQSKPFEKLGNYDAQKDFFDRYFWPEIQLRICIHELGLQANNLLTALAVQLQEELLGEPTVTAPSKKQLKKLNKQKAASSLVVPKPEAAKETSASAEEASVLAPTPSWKPVHLPPFDSNSHSSAAPAGGASSSEITYFEMKAGNAAASAVSRLATRASVCASAITAPWSEAISSLKQPNKLDFSQTLNILTRDFDATIEEGAIYTIRLRGPTGTLTNIYCHHSHGAQDKKPWPAWRINMKEGLRAAGYEW
jgi:hypothetical protein